jgi:hypothetical protein
MTPLTSAELLAIYKQLDTMETTLDSLSSQLFADGIDAGPINNARAALRRTMNDLQASIGAAIVVEQGD